MRRYSVIWKAQRFNPNNNTNVSWAGGQVEDNGVSFSSLTSAISYGRRVAKEKGLKYGDVRISDIKNDMPYEEAKPFSFADKAPRILDKEQ